jgi:hypothetical protein
VLLQQISCLSSGADAGWRLRSFSSSSSSDSSSFGPSSDAAAAAVGLQQSLAPRLRLAAGEGCSHYMQLISPAAADNSSRSSSSQELLPVLQGPLHYFYKQGSAAGLGRLSGSGGGSAAAAAVLQQPLPLLPGEGLQQQLRPLVSEPPVDLLLMWQLEPHSTGLTMNPSGQIAQQQQQQQGRPRAGLMSFYDLCAAQQLNPVRMTLEGPGLTAPHKHDFRAALLCIVPLTLKLRNCGTAAVSLTVRAAGAWEGLAADHAWWATPTPPGSKHSGLLGSSSAAAAAAAGVSSGGAGPVPPGSPAVAAGMQAVPQLGPLAAGAAGLSATAGGGGGGFESPGLPPRPRTPQSSTAAAAGMGGGSLVGVGGEGLGAVFSGLGVRGASPLRGAAGSAAPGSFQQQPATAAAAVDPMAAAVQAGLPPSAEHVWCGATCVPVRQLEPGGSVEAVLQVAVFKPGVYVLDDYGVDWRCEGMQGPGGRVRQGSKVGEAVVLKVESPCGMSAAAPGSMADATFC